MGKWQRERRKNDPKVKVESVEPSFQAHILQENELLGFMWAAEAINHSFRKNDCTFCLHAKINAVEYWQRNKLHSSPVVRAGKGFVDVQTYTSACLSFWRKDPHSGSSLAHISDCKSLWTFPNTNLPSLRFFPSIFSDRLSYSVSLHAAHAQHWATIKWLEKTNHKCDGCGPARGLAPAVVHVFCHLRQDPLGVCPSPPVLICSFFSGSRGVLRQTWS